MKKALTLIVVLTIAASLFAGCGQQGDNAAPSEAPAAAEPVKTAEIPAEEASVPAASEEAEEEEEEDCVEAQGCEERMLPKYEGAPEECVRWCGEAYELGALTSVEIEFGEPYGREGCHEECRVRQELAAGHQHLWAMDLVEEVEENAAGCDAKRDNIRQGIQLFSDGGRYSQKPCREAIEEVKGGSDENHQDCPLVLSVEGCSCGDAT